jgi:hypothetical protein
MASANDQEFDDDIMLQLAMAMSMQASAQITPPASVVEVPVGVTKDDEDTPALIGSSDPSATGDVEALLPLDNSIKKKRKKKDSYASLMANVMAPTLSDEEKRKENDAKLKSQLGGGQFSKLEKI